MFSIKVADTHTGTQTDTSTDNIMGRLKLAAVRANSWMYIGIFFSF